MHQAWPPGAWGLVPVGSTTGFSVQWHQTGIQARILEAVASCPKHAGCGQAPSSPP